MKNLTLNCNTYPEDSASFRTISDARGEPGCEIAVTQDERVNYIGLSSQSVARLKAWLNEAFPDIQPYKEPVYVRVLVACRDQDNLPVLMRLSVEVDSLADLEEAHKRAHSCCVEWGLKPQISIDELDEPIIKEMPWDGAITLAKDKEGQ